MEHYDVAIIGGGLIACASAYYLSRSACRVVVLERGELNQGASGQNAGSLHFQLENRLLEHRDKLQKELEYFLALTLRAVDQWRHIEAELGCDLGLVMDGGFMVAESSEDIKILEEKSLIETAQGLQVELLDSTAVHRLAPYLGDSVRAALHCPWEGQCNPRLLTPAFARNAQARGSRVLTGAAVNGLRVQDRQWELSFCLEREGNRQERISAGVVLNAAGAWAAEVAMFADVSLPLVPVGLTLNVTEKTAPLVHHLIQHASRKLSMKQVADGNLLIGGGWLADLQRQGEQWLSSKPALMNIDTVKQNLRVAADIVPLVQDLHLLRSWTGITTIAPDELPVLGEMPGAPGFYIAAGGNGFTLGPTYALLMSELILNGSTSFPLAPYGPARFA